MLDQSSISAVRTMIVAGLCALAGCARFSDLPPTLPDQTAIVRDQLVVSSTFALPKKHRLVEELAAQRYDLSVKLALPTSDEPIHVYLFDNADKFAAFMRQRFPSFPQRRAFFVETDTQLTVYAHWGDRVAEDLRHEVAHGYLHAVVPNLPLWLDEGLAEYFEVPRGRRGFNRPHVEALSQQLAAGGWRPDMRRLESLLSAAGMTQLDYAESWAWVHLLLEGQPQATPVLKDYLNVLRRDGAAEPLSARLARQLPNHAEAFANHVYQLAQQPADAP